MLEVKRCNHPQVKRDFLAFDSLHPNDKNRHWEYWPPLLRRLANADLHRQQVAADIKASQPSVQQPGPKHGKVPPAAPALLGEDTGTTDTGALSKTQQRKQATAAKTAAKAAAAEAATKPQKTKTETKSEPKASLSALSFVTKTGAIMTEDQKLNRLRQVLKTAEEAKIASTAAAAFSHGKGMPPKAPPAHLVAERLAAAKKETKGGGQPQVTTGGTAPKKHGGVDTPTAGSEKGSQRSVNSPRSVTSEGGTKTEARRPGPGYACKICQSAKHWLAECPHKGTAMDNGKGSGKGGKPPGVTWGCPPPLASLPAAARRSATTCAGGALGGWPFPWVKAAAAVEAILASSAVLST